MLVDALVVVSVIYLPPTSTSRRSRETILKIG